MEPRSSKVSHGGHASYQRWRDLDAAAALGGLAGYSVENEVNWLDGAAAVSIVPMIVTANFFDVTGVPVARGRGFSEREIRAELDPHVAVVTDEFGAKNLAPTPRCSDDRSCSTANHTRFSECCRRSSEAWSALASRQASICRSIVLSFP